MSGHDRNDRIQDLLDGLLAPADVAEVEELVRTDPQWEAEHREMRSLHALLDEYLDVAPPADLAPSVLKAVTSDRVRRRVWWRMPARLENTLVVAGASALALAVFGGPRLLSSGGEGWPGRAAVSLTQAFTGGLDRVAQLATSTTQLDWLGRLLTTLSDAARTVVASSAEPLLLLSASAIVLTGLVAWVLVKSEKGPREGGLRHAHLVA